MKVNSLKKLIEKTHTNIQTIDYLIRTKHNFLLLINNERESKIIINTNNYSSIKEVNNTYYITTKEPIIINNSTPIQIFEINIDNDDDILGFISREEVLKFCNESNINTSKILTSKIIFSPQLANYLLDRGYKIIHLKPKNDNSNQTVFVFAVEKGFYDEIYNYRKEEKWYD